MIVMDNITATEAEAGNWELWDWLAETHGDNLYSIWINEKSVIKRRLIAMEIRDLPWRKTEA
jgi:hypothetical protein